MIKKVLEKGSLNISEDVFSFITSIVIDGTDGIAGTVSHIKDDFKRVVNRKGNQKGINVDHSNDDLVSIDVKISVYFGSNICDMCYMLQQKIAEEIEIMTGIKVACINIFVDSVQLKE